MDRQLKIEKPVKLPCQWFASHSYGSLLRHEDHGGRTVGERGSVAGGDGAALFLEDGRQLRELLEVDLLVFLILGNNYWRFAALHDHGHVKEFPLKFESKSNLKFGEIVLD